MELGSGRSIFVANQRFFSSRSFRPRVFGVTKLHQKYYSGFKLQQEP